MTGLKNRGHRIGRRMGGKGGVAHLFLCVWSMMIHSLCFHNTGPPQGISDHHPNHVSLTEGEREREDGGRRQTGERQEAPKRGGGLKRRACCLQELSEMV